MASISQTRSAAHRRAVSGDRRPLAPINGRPPTEAADVRIVFDRDALDVGLTGAGRGGYQETDG